LESRITSNDRCKTEAIEQAVQRPVSVRNDDQLVSRIPKLLQRRHHEVRRDLPEIVLAVILANFRKRGRSLFGQLHAGFISASSKNEFDRR